MVKIIVMLLWIGDMRGGPAVIQGFDSLESCRDAVPKVEKFYRQKLGVNWSNIFSASCEELNK